MKNLNWYARSAFAAVALSSALIVAGCGSDKVTKTTTTEETTTTAVPPPAPPTESTTTTTVTRQTQP